MYDIEKLIDATAPADILEPAHRGLAGFCDELAEQLRNEAREREAKRTRGFKSFADAVGVATAELAKVSAALRKHDSAAAPAEPIECKAVNQLGAKCMRTEPGHVSHTYPPTEPKAGNAEAGSSFGQTFTTEGLERGVVHDGAGGPFVVQDTDDPDRITVRRVCGIADKYVRPLETGTQPDRCLLDSHGPDQNHEGAWSKWPWQDAAADGPSGSGSDDLAEVAQLASPRSTPEQIRAFLKGEADELGTEPLFIEPRGEVAVSGVVEDRTVTTTATGEDAEKITAGVLTGFPVGYVETGLSTPVTIMQEDPIKLVPEELLMQPDPFDNALPDPRPAPTGIWMGGAQPVKPDPRPLWLPRDVAPLTPYAVRTTQVRTGEQCGMAYRLISRDQVPEVPSWANIGGSTLHACAMRYEYAVLEGMAPEVLDEATARAWWNHFFPLEIGTAEVESPFGRAYWRAADKGAEGEAWWNEAGPLMVRDYAAWSAQMHADGWSILRMGNAAGINLGPTPAMEMEMHTPLITGEISGHLDQAWIRSVHLEMIGPPDVSICVIDLKSGSRMPEDDWQLQAYPWELRYRLHSSGMAVERITWSAAYYDARNGKLCDPITPRMDDAEINYRATSVLRMHESNNYPANPGTTYKDPCYVCAVRYACPIMARRA